MRVFSVTLAHSPCDRADAILYEPRTHQLYTFNGKSANVNVLDAVSLKPLATVAVSGKPEFAVSDGAGRIFVNIEDKAQIDVIDVATHQVLAHWPLKGCVEPTGLALDAAHHRLFSVCQNKVMLVTDAANGAQVAQAAIGARPDAVVYHAASATVYSSNGDGTLSIIAQKDADHYAPAATLATQAGARTMALDPATRNAYLPVVVNQQFTVLVVKP